MDELRAKGLAKMNEVYGWEMPNIEGNPYFDLTVDHLFGTIWTRPGLSMRDKRIMTLTAVAALGIVVAANIGTWLHPVPALHAFLAGVPAR